MGSMLLGDLGFLAGYKGSRVFVYKCMDCEFVWKVEENE